MKKIGHLFLAFSLLCGLWSATAGAQADIDPAHPQFTPVAGLDDHSPQTEHFDSSGTASSQTSAAGKRNIVPNQVLVKYKKGVSTPAARSHASQFAAQAVESDDRLGAMKLELPSDTDVFETIKAMNENPDVDYAQPVYIYKASEAAVTGTVYANDLDSRQWGITAAHLDSMWGKVNAGQRSQIKIAILDSGVDFNHPDLKDSLLVDQGANFINPSAAPTDDYGHGTHVAGIAAAIVNNGLGIAGVAGSAKIIPVKVMDQNGDGNTDTVSKGLVWAADHGAQVINLSLGGNHADPYLQDAILYAQQKGALVVAAAGNESNRFVGSDPRNLDGLPDPAGKAAPYAAPVGYPAAYPGVLAVGALDDPTNKNGKGLSSYSYADFSNSGPDLDVLAPGVNIFSTMMLSTNTKYGSKSGTSMAAPFVTGLAAVIKAGNPNLSADQLQKIITATAVDLGTPGKDDDYGYGFIDGARALDIPRLTLETANTVAAAVYKGITDAYTSLPVSVRALDYKGNINAGVSSDTWGNVELQVDKYDPATGQWNRDETLSEEIALTAGTAAANLQLPSDGVYSVTAAAASADHPYVPSDKLFSGRNLPSANAKLQYLRINNGQYGVIPAFDAERTYYETRVPSSVTSVAIATAADDPAASVTLNGAALPASGTRTVSLNEGENLVPITVTAEDHSTRTYTIMVVREVSTDNNFISSLYFDSGALTPDFNKNVQNYTLYLDNSRSQTGMSISLESDKAAITIKGQTVPTDVLLLNNEPYPVGSTSVPITVTSASGQTRTYTVTVVRLSGTLGGGMLKHDPFGGGIAFSPSFNPENYTYWGSVGAATSTATLTADPVDRSASITLNGSPISPGYAQTVVLNPGSNVFQIAVSASDKDVKMYTFSISRPSASTGGGNSGGSRGGGGGGGGFYQPPATPTEPNQPPVVVRADDEQLKSSLESASTVQATIDATTGASAQTLRVEFGASVLKLAAERNKMLVIDTGNHRFELPPGAVNVTDTAGVAALVVTASRDETILSKKPEQARDITPIYDFSLTVDGAGITRFAKPLSIQWSLPAQAGNPDKLGAYYFNPDRQVWTYAGGKANSDGTFTFTTDHFSQYAVMEYNKTFDDMTEHWARNEVELLASKYIVDGLTDTTFGPEQRLTRAEFAALLVRLLGITTVNDTGVFRDVAAADWYHDVVYQAYGAGLIEGMDASTFAPTEPITREQMAVMILRAYGSATGKKAEDLSASQAAAFADEGRIGGWALGGVRLVSGLGLMDGFPDGSFKPQDTATRAQAAAVVKRVMDAVQP